MQAAEHLGQIREHFSKWLEADYADAIYDFGTVVEVSVVEPTKARVTRTGEDFADKTFYSTLGPYTPEVGDRVMLQRTLGGLLIIGALNKEAIGFEEITEDVPDPTLAEDACWITNQTNTSATIPPANFESHVVIDGFHYAISTGNGTDRPERLWKTQFSSPSSVTFVSSCDLPNGNSSILGVFSNTHVVLATAQGVNQVDVSTMTLGTPTAGYVPTFSSVLEMASVVVDNYLYMTGQVFGSGTEAGSRIIDVYNVSVNPPIYESRLVLPDADGSYASGIMGDDGFLYLVSRVAGVGGTLLRVTRFTLTASTISKTTSIDLTLTFAQPTNEIIFTQLGVRDGKLYIYFDGLYKIDLATLALETYLRLDYDTTFASRSTALMMGDDAMYMITGAQKLVGVNFDMHEIYSTTGGGNFLPTVLYGGYLYDVNPPSSWRTVKIDTCATTRNLNIVDFVEYNDLTNTPVLKYVAPYLYAFGLDGSPELTVILKKIDISGNPTVVGQLDLGSTTTEFTENSVCHDDEFLYISVDAPSVRIVKIDLASFTVVYDQLLVDAPVNEFDQNHISALVISSTGDLLAIFGGDHLGRIDSSTAEILETTSIQSALGTSGSTLTCYMVPVDRFVYVGFPSVQFSPIDWKLVKFQTDTTSLRYRGYWASEPNDGWEFDTSANLDYTGEHILVSGSFDNSVAVRKMVLTRKIPRFVDSLMSPSTNYPGRSDHYPVLSHSEVDAFLCTGAIIMRFNPETMEYVESLQYPVPARQFGGGQASFATDGTDIWALSGGLFDEDRPMSLTRIST
jgi:hypothetical protein